MNPALKELLTQTVEIRKFIGLDAYGKASFGAPMLLPTRIEYKVQIQPSPQGYIRVQQTRLFLDGAVQIDARDHLTLPNGTSPGIMVLYDVPALDGSIDHYELFL